MEMLDAMQTGRFKVAAHLENWFEEYRLYHRKDGKVEKIYDDLLSATRYAWMMRRFAVPEGGEQYAEETYDYDSREGGWMS